MFMLFPLFSLTYVPHGLAYICLVARLLVSASARALPIQTVNGEFVEPISSIYDWMKWSLLIKKMQHQNITLLLGASTKIIEFFTLGLVEKTPFCLYIFFNAKCIIDQAHCMWIAIMHCFWTFKRRQWLITK